MWKQTQFTQMNISQKFKLKKSWSGCHCTWAISSWNNNEVGKVRPNNSRHSIVGYELPVLKSFIKKWQ